MKTIEDINLHTWYTQRELEFVPAHFVKSTTPLTQESKEWVLEKLNGRFATSTKGIFSSFTPFVAFEDPKEALFYELTWS